MKRFSAGNVIRWLLRNGNWMTKHQVAHWFFLIMPPEYFSRGAHRLELSTRESYCNWAFSREVRDLVRRNQVERQWDGPASKPHSLYKLRLTDKGRKIMEKLTPPLSARLAKKHGI